MIPKRSRTVSVGSAILSVVTLIAFGSCGGGTDPLPGANGCAQVGSGGGIWATLNSGSSNAYYANSPCGAPSSQSGSTITGTVVLGTSNGSAVSPTSTPVSAASVWLEQPSRPVQVQGAGTEAVENLVAKATTNSSGTFSFGGLTSGSYDVVVDSSSLPSGAASEPTITIGINPGSANLLIPLIDGPSAAIAGEVTSTSSSGGGAGDDVFVLPLQQFQPPSSSVLQVIVPFLSGTTPSPPALTTNSTGSGCSSSCPAQTNCACYVLQVPDAGLVSGGPSSSGNGYTASNPSPLNYSVGAQASVKGTANPVCSPSELASQQFGVSSGTNSAPTLDFKSCD